MLQQTESEMIKSLLAQCVSDGSRVYELFCPLHCMVSVVGDVLLMLRMRLCLTLPCMKNTTASVFVLLSCIAVIPMYQFTAGKIMEVLS